MAFKTTKKLKVLWSNLNALKNIYLKKDVVSNPPTHIWLEPTNHCNLKCVMCPIGTDQITIEKGNMDFELYKDIIQEIKSYVSAVTLAVHGESFIHPQFIDMVNYAADNGIKPLLNTNGTLINQKMAHQLIDSKIAYISFAFDGFHKAQYEKARRGAKFEKTLENILYFLNLKRERNQKNPYCILSMLELGLEPYTEEQKDSFLSQFEGLIDEIRLREVSTWGANFKDTEDFNPRIHEKEHLPCARLYSTVTIGWNGNVLPCIYNSNHEYVLGNIKEKPLLKIWNDLQMKKLRHSMFTGEHLKVSPLCENCIVTGTPPLLGIPSGIRLTLTDAMNNFLGFGFEKRALAFANFLRKGKFSSKTILSYDVEEKKEPEKVLEKAKSTH